MKPAATAAAEQICDVSSVLVVALVRSMPRALNLAGVIAFGFTRPSCCSQTPRLPT